MRRLSVILLSLFLAFPFRVKADTDYNSILNDIFMYVYDTADASWSVFDRLYDIQQILSSSLSSGHIPTATEWATLQTALNTIRDKINDIDSYVSSIESFSSYLPDIFNKTDSITYYLYNELSTYLSTMQDSLSSIDSFGDSLQDIVDAVNDCAAQAGQIALNQAGLNQEETQQDILDALEDIRGRMTVFPEEDIHTLVSLTENIYNSIALIYSLMNKWDSVFDDWSLNYFSMFGAHLGSTVRTYFHMTGAPDFINGYTTAQVDMRPISEGSDFVSSLFSMLTAHLDVLLDINNAVLFIAKNFSTNGQQQVENEFQDQKYEIASSLDHDYQQLRSYTYNPASFNFQDAKLHSISEFLSAWESPNYDAVRVYNVDISDFSNINPALPTYFEFKYDLSSISNYLELCRTVFTIFWVLFFASFWLFLVHLFYRFYNFLYLLLCMIPGQAAPPPGPGLPVPTSGAVMA